MWYTDEDISNQYPPILLTKVEGREGDNNVP